ncbi:MAG: FAD binding domain-containing protein [Candidatus Muirbacterium halophilum]|nr:FAD binding domain-containing protein [Candidatus Muirbacterium halophilum]MCK9475187.1 FAD binding domain-containing protein [Candidatus Muirbacterium halophilum]
MKYFDYFSFDTLGETLEFLKKQKHFVKIISGGTDLIIEFRKNSPKLENIDKVLDISRLRVLKVIEEDNDYVYIGPSCTHTEIVKNDIINKYFPALVEACLSIGCLQTRNQGTIGGNIVNSSPSADTVPALVSYNAELELLKDENIERIFKVKDFIKGPYKNELAKDEMLYCIRIPKDNTEDRLHVFEKLGRRNALSITRISVCANALLEDGKIKKITIVPGAVLPRFKNMKIAEDFLTGKKPQKEVLREASELVAKEVFDEVGERWSTPYKKPVLEKMAFVALCKMFKIEII